jgi:hypothetical protein
VQPPGRDAVTGQGTGQGVHWRDRTAPGATVDSRHNLSPHNLPQEEKKMPAQDDTIRPFHVGFPEAELTDLRRRVNATR